MTSLSSDRPSGPVAAPQQVQCLCGHDAGSHNALKFNCMATTGGTHATRCGCKAFTDADRPSGQTPTEAGPAMDILVAQKVMGWRRIQTVPSRTDRLSGKIVAPRNIGIPEGERLTKNLPHFSTDIAAAWLVLEKMSGPGFTVDLRANGAGTFDCSWWLHDDPKDECLAEETDVDTAPLAICRAALSCCGMEPINV